jgi:rhodanese-related sulfurtransferase
MKNKTAKTSLVLVLLVISLVTFAQEIKSKQQVYSENLKDTPQINPKELKNKMDSLQEFILIDLRTEREHDAGYISGSIWIPRGFLEFKIQEVCTNPETEIIVYCGRGGLSILAVKSLQRLGYKNVFSVEGGMIAWVENEFTIYNQHGEIKVVNLMKKDPYLSTYDIFNK